MRIAAMIIATLCLLASAGLGMARSKTNFADAKEFDDKVGGSVDKETIAAAKAAGLKSASVLEIKPSALRRGGVGMILTGVLSLVLLIGMYVKKGVPALAGVLVVFSAATVFMNPHYDVGSLQAMSARSAAYVIAALAAGGALFAFAADRLQARRRRSRMAPIGHAMAS